jgi:hypothetical protein
MKKLFKIPALLFAIMLIVSSCGNGRNANDDAETLVNSLQDFERLMTKAEKADGKKKIKLYEEAEDELENLIEIAEYYAENKDNYEKLEEAMEEFDEEAADEMESYKEFKKGKKKFIKDIKIALKSVEELKDED